MEEDTLSVRHITAPLPASVIRKMRRDSARGKPVRLAVDLDDGQSVLVTLLPATVGLLAAAQAEGYTTSVVLGTRGGPLEAGVLVERSDRPRYALFCRHEWDWYRIHGSLAGKPPCAD